MTLTLSSNIIDDSNHETSLSYKLLLIDILVSRLPKAFANNSSDDTNLSKTQLSKCCATYFICKIIKKKKLNPKKEFKKS